MTMSRVAIVGATGAVGRTMLAILEERDFPVKELRLLASDRSAGSEIPTRWGTVTVENLATADPAGLDIALFSAGGDRSRDYAPKFAEAGCTVVDNSSAFRMQADVPLVVAGVNDAALAGHHGIIANPNCTTMALLMAVGPLHRAAGLRSMVATSYQSVSGSGMAGMDELVRQNAALATNRQGLVDGSWSEPGDHVYVRPIGWNVLPFAGNPAAEGYTDEEWKLVNETRKILDTPDIAIEPTCVRVPVMVGHGIAATMTFSRPLDTAEATSTIAASPGVQVWEDRIPTPLDSAGIDDVLVGRIRPTVGTPGGISLWAVGDNLRKGAALNTVEIAELLIA